MTRGAGNPVNIRARLTARDLARAIGKEPSDVTAALSARGEPDSLEDFLDSELARAVATDLGVEVTVETRDLVLEALYEHETRGDLSTQLDGRAARIAEGVIERREVLDQSIEEASEHWSVARMPMVDRNILRLGLYELRYELETPAAVIISEAVRLAQTYSTERSASFVNGVLAALAEDTRA